MSPNRWQGLLVQEAQLDQLSSVAASLSGTGMIHRAGPLSFKAACDSGFYYIRHIHQ